MLLIRMPVGAVASILHRLSGALLFLSLPAAAFILDLSLQGPEGFAEAARLLTSPPARVLMLLLTWSLVHHVLAGLRFLLIDVEVGVDKKTARGSAYVVNLAAPLLALLFIWSLG